MINIDPLVSQYTMLALNPAERFGVGFGAVGLIFIVICIYKVLVDHIDRKKKYNEYIQRTVIVNDKIWGDLTLNDEVV